MPAFCCCCTTLHTILYTHENALPHIASKHNMPVGVFMLLIMCVCMLCWCCCRCRCCDRIIADPYARVADDSRHWTTNNDTDDDQFAKDSQPDATYADVAAYRDCCNTTCNARVVFAQTDPHLKIKFSHQTSNGQTYTQSHRNVLQAHHFC